MNEKVVSFIFGVLLGAAAGAGVSFTVIKKKMDDEMNKEKESLWAIVDKERAKNKEEKDALLAAQQAMSERNKNKPDVDAFIFAENNKQNKEEKIAASKAFHDYTAYSAMKAEDEAEMDEDDEEVEEEPDIEYISEEEYGNTPDYAIRSWTFTANNVLLDDDLDPVEPDEMIETVGNDFDKHLGESTDGSVFIRNHRLQVDVAIMTSIETSNELNRR